MNTIDQICVCLANSIWRTAASTAISVRVWSDEKEMAGGFVCQCNETVLYNSTTAYRVFVADRSVITTVLWCCCQDREEEKEEEREAKIVVV